MKRGDTDRFCKVSLETGLASQITIRMRVVMGQCDDAQFSVGGLITQSRCDTIGTHAGQLQSQQHHRGQEIQCQLQRGLARG